MAGTRRARSCSETGRARTVTLLPAMPISCLKSWAISSRSWSLSDPFSSRRRIASRSHSGKVLSNLSSFVENILDSGIFIGICPRSGKRTDSVYHV